MKTIKELIDWSVKHGVEVSIRPEITPNALPVVAMTFSDMAINKHFRQLIDVGVLREIQIPDEFIQNIIMKAQAELNLAYPAPVRKFRDRIEPDFVKVGDMEINIDECKARVYN